MFELNGESFDGEPHRVWGASVLSVPRDGAIGIAFQYPDKRERGVALMAPHVAPFFLALEEAIQISRLESMHELPFLDDPGVRGASVLTLEVADFVVHSLNKRHVLFGFTTIAPGPDHFLAIMPADLADNLVQALRRNMTAS